MYIPTYIYILKNCNQDPYGFQNFMSSWGSWSKISKLQQVGDVSFFQSKSSLFIFTTTWESFFCECKENGANEPVYLQCPFGVQRLSIYTTRPEGPSYGWMEWMGWMGWNIKGILQIFILCGNIEHVYTYLYILKNCNLRMGWDGTEGVRRQERGR